MTSPIPPAAAARCREVVRLLELAIQQPTFPPWDNYQKNWTDLRVEVRRVVEIMKAQAATDHRPAVSVERLRALRHTHLGARAAAMIPWSDIEALCKEAEAAQ